MGAGLPRTSGRAEEGCRGQGRVAGEMAEKARQFHLMMTAPGENWGEPGSTGRASGGEEPTV